MYELLLDISQRPEPFSHYTAKELWTRPHLAKKMLTAHLDQATDQASFRISEIERVIDWIDEQVNLREKRVCDLGCGPGLYTQRFADRGAEVTGVDFSAHSLEYAFASLDSSEHTIAYINADYLEDDLPSGFDVVSLIYTDLCSLSPEQRAMLLGRMRGMLNTGGQIVIDVAGVGAFEQKKELTRMEPNLMQGFWAEGDYVGIHRTFVYPEVLVSLDRFLIVEPKKSWEIFNWVQYFTPEVLQSELVAAGFTINLMAGSLTGGPLEVDGNLVVAIARVA